MFLGQGSPSNSSWCTLRRHALVLGRIELPRRAFSIADLRIELVFPVARLLLLKRGERVTLLFAWG